MKVYNTLKRQKEEFVPLTENTVKMYVCGPTVYDFIHIGNARPIVVFDTVRKYLMHKGYNVEYVQNFTDVDDKIINRANDTGVTSLDISERFIEEVQTDMKNLNVLQATHNPKVTEEIEEIVEMVKVLIEKGYAYEVDGNVYFDAKKYNEYGKLSRRNIDDLLSGARVEINEDKKSAVDFVLWKKAKPLEPFWTSPWGNGRPGWHIECSVMAKKYLGDSIDIHAGGEDLIFPHHENEIAQSECANDAIFAKYWLHNGFINIDNQKMSKSKGNFFTIRDIVKDYEYMEVRLFLLSGHYRSPINFSEELMQSTRKSLERIRNGVDQLTFYIQSANDGDVDTDIKKSVEEMRAKFYERMDDDFNTADAISLVFELIKLSNIELKNNISKQSAMLILDEISLYLDILGIIATKSIQAELTEDEINDLIEQRKEAKKAKDFAKADEIRQTLLDKNIVIEDTRAGTKWSVKQ